MLEGHLFLFKWFIAACLLGNLSGLFLPSTNAWELNRK